MRIMQSHRPRTNVTIRPASSAIPALAAFLAVGLLAGTSANAALIAYDGIDYTDGDSLIGKNGGSGAWAGAWSKRSSGSETNVASGSTLSYTDTDGDALPTTGNGAVIPRVSRGAGRSISPTLSTGVNWVSYLVRPEITPRRRRHGRYRLRLRYRVGQRHDQPWSRCE